jgi:hypothetical protein
METINTREMQIELAKQDKAPTSFINEDNADKIDAPIKKIRPRRIWEPVYIYRRRVGLLTDEEEAAENEKKEDKRREKRRLYERKRYQKKKRKRRWKKKRGPKKKPGPKPKRKRKKKPKPRVSPFKLPPFKYRIGYFRNGKFWKYMGKYRYLTDARKDLAKLESEVKKPLLPEMRVHNDWWVEDSYHEYVLMVKGGTGETLLPNEYGKYVLNLTTDDWTIIDKVRFDVEETFWIWGFDYRYERKDCQWIYDNILVQGLETKYDFMRVYTYRNKILFKNDDEQVRLVISKTDTDAVRLYNKLQEMAKKKKMKNALFIGDYSEQIWRYEPVVNEIYQITKWPQKQIHMYSTTYSLTRTRVQDKINHRNSRLEKDVNEILDRYGSIDEPDTGLY